MKTYLFKDNTHYKIGKSNNVFERYKSIKCHNPSLEVVTFIDKNIETFLHRKYKKNRDLLEWFLFTESEFEELLKTDFDNPNISEIPFLDYKFSSGKYKDRYLVSMFLEQEINYVKTIDNTYCQYWAANYLRYNFLKDILVGYNNIQLRKEPIVPYQHGEAERLVELIDELHYNKQLFKTNSSDIEKAQLVDCLLVIGDVLNLKTIAQKAKELNTDYNNVKKSAMKKVTLFGVKFVIDNE